LLNETVPAKIAVAFELTVKRELPVGELIINKSPIVSLVTCKRPTPVPPKISKSKELVALFVPLIRNVVPLNVRLACAYD
jgi:hypothetical protein